MAKKVLITGASGFIGLNTVKKIVQNGNFDIFALTNRNLNNELKEVEGIKILRADLTDNNSISFIAGFDFDVIIHIAGLASDIGKDETFRKINYETVKSLAHLPKEKFIYISSTDVYGIKDFKDASEETQFLEFPKNPYPKYKIKSEEYIRQNCKNYVIIRPAAVWGKNDKTLENRVVEFLKDSPFIVHFGKWKGKNRWPLADVENVSSVILSVLKNNDFDNQAINIIDSKVTTIDEYYRNIIEKYFPDKKFKTLYLPLWFGKILGFCSTFLSNILNLKEPLFDPTFYALHHVSSNLDFSSRKMETVLELLNKNKVKV